jgi:predicted nucleic acid-binding protein
MGSVQAEVKKVKVFIDASVLIAATMSKHGKARDLILALLMRYSQLLLDSCLKEPSAYLAYCTLWARRQK